MTRRFLAKWQKEHPEGDVNVRDLMKTDLKFVDAPWLQAYFTPSERHSPEMKEALRLSDELVGELSAADHVVIATPVYNYNVPAALKAWVDHVVRRGMTLGLDGKGMLKGKRATVLLASGGVYTEGSPFRDRDIATQYLRLILNLIGISDVTVVRTAIERLASGLGDMGAVSGRIASISMVENYRNFGTLCGSQCQLLQMHHDIEEGSLYPKLRRNAGLGSVLDRLSEEHHTVHALLQRIQEISREVSLDPTGRRILALKDIYEVFEKIVVSHFRYEERELEEAIGYYDAL